MNETVPLPENGITETHSAGGLVLNKKGQVLVVNQKGSSWSLPKGHIEAGEDNLTAAKREILEETGISDLKLAKDLGEYSRPRMGLGNVEDPTEIKKISFYLFTSDQTDLVPRDPDNPEAVWLSQDEAIAKLTHPKDKEFLRQSLADLD